MNASHFSDPPMIPSRRATRGFTLTPPRETKRRHVCYFSFSLLSHLPIKACFNALVWAQFSSYL